MANSCIQFRVTRAFPSFLLLLLFAILLPSSKASNLPGFIDAQNFPSSSGVIVIGDYVGFSAAGGDFNGDGFQDFIVTASSIISSSATVIFGKASFPPNITIATLNASEGISITFDSDFAAEGIFVASCDFNGDKFDDIVLGFPAGTPNTSRVSSGVVYIIYGGKNLPSAINLATLSATQGVLIVGQASRWKTGSAVSKVKDMNGDGFDELLIGSSLGDFGVYLVYGRSNAPPVIDLLTFQTGVVAFKGALNDNLGSSVCSAGDVNGDGIPDFLFGVANNNRAYLVFGRNNFVSPVDITTFSIPEVLFQASSGNFGTAVSPAGDVNGDGLSDFMISAPEANDLRTRSGTVYFIYGKKSFAPVVNIPADFNSTVGVRIVGAYANNRIASKPNSLNGGSDMNGDGVPDITIGLSETLNSAAYILYGGKYNTASVFDLLNATATDGCSFSDQVGSGLGAIGSAVNFVGDVNGDGAIDIVIGANDYSPTAVAYVLFGIPNPSSSTSLTPSFTNLRSHSPSPSPSPTASTSVPGRQTPTPHRKSKAPTKISKRRESVRPKKTESSGLKGNQVTFAAWIATILISMLAMSV